MRSIMGSDDKHGSKEPLETVTPSANRRRSRTDAATVVAKRRLPMPYEERVQPIKKSRGVEPGEHRLPNTYRRISNTPSHSKPSTSQSTPEVPRKPDVVRPREMPPQDSEQVRDIHPKSKSYTVTTEYTRSASALHAVETVYAVKFNREYVGSRIADMTGVIYAGAVVGALERRAIAAPCCL